MREFSREARSALEKAFPVSQVSSSNGRASVSKTECCGFESCLACFSRMAARAAFPVSLSLVRLFRLAQKNYR